MKLLFYLRDLSDNQITEIVNHYKDFAGIKHDSKEIQTKAEEYALRNSHKFSMSEIVKSLFWYVYNKQVPGLTGVLKLK